MAGVLARHNFKRKIFWFAIEIFVAAHIIYLGAFFFLPEHALAWKDGAVAGAVLLDRIVSLFE